MTVYEYLVQIPKDLFEATLMGLMGIAWNEEKEITFRKWLNSPYQDSFPSMPMPSEFLRSYGSIFGEKYIPLLPPEKEVQLKNALKNYCEVCDFINQYLTDKQKDIDRSD